MKKKKITTLSFALAFDIKTSFGKCVALLYLLLTGAPSLSYSQTLAEWKSFSGNSGIASIPFSPLRGDLGAMQNAKNEMVSAAVPYTKLYGQKSEQYKQIRLENERIKIDQRDIDALKDKTNSSDISKRKFLESELPKRDVRIQGFRDEIKRINGELSKAVDHWDRIHKIRGGIREYFNDALSKLASAKENPNRYLGSNPSDADKTLLIGFIDTIKVKIESEVSEHQRQEDGARNASNNFDKELRRDSE